VLRACGVISICSAQGSRIFFLSLRHRVRISRGRAFFTERVLVIGLPSLIPLFLSLVFPSLSPIRFHLILIVVSFFLHPYVVRARFKYASFNERLSRAPLLLFFPFPFVYFLDSLSGA